MKRRAVIKTFLSAALLSPLAPQLALGAVRKRTTSKPGKCPNIILILADDLGYSALGSYGNRFNETPNLDRLAREGMRFTDAYASSTVCSPTRAALMTGQHPARTGLTNYLEGDDVNFLSPSYITINERLKSAGYVTGLVGKWHLTGDYAKKRGTPEAHGWDEVILSETEHIKLGAYFAPYFFMPEVGAREPDEYLTDRLNQEAVEFIRRHQDEPFFLYLSHYAPHTNLAAKPDLIAKYERKPGAGAQKGKNPILAAMLESIDDGVGQIMQALEELGLEDDTLLIFTSDNGGETNVTTNAPLRAGKSWLYEGGIRVPLVMRYPPGVRAGAVNRTPVVTHDWYPTFMELAHVRSRGKQPFDGASMVRLFKDGDLARDTLYWHYPLAEPHFLGGLSSGAMRHRDYKLIEFFDTGDIELYNLREDIGETNNLARVMPGKVTALRDKLEQWREWVGASMDPMRG